MIRSILVISIIISGVLCASAQTYNAVDADGKRHGIWQKKYDNSTQLRYEGTFEHGKEVGVFKFYQPSNGEKPTAIKTFSKASDSVQVRYYTLAQQIISEGVMIKKKRVGTWKYYHKNSPKIMMTETYIDGKLDGEQRVYFKNKQLAEVSEYTAGKRNGIQVIYAEDGALIKKYTYIAGELHGPTAYYDTSGVLLIEGNYKNDRKDGIWKYYENGKLKERKKFPLKPKER